MRTLCFVGDTHGMLISMYAQLVKWMERTGQKIDAIVQVGDFGVCRNGTGWSTMWHNRAPAPIPTWACMGNHEEIMMVNDWEISPNQIPDMHLMRDGEVADVLGVNIGVVWGNYSPISWLSPSRVHENRATGQSGRIAMHIDRDAVHRLLNDPRPIDVLVTHDSAACTLPVEFRESKMPFEIRRLLGLEPNEEVGGCPAFSELLRVKKPGEYFFGHLHCFDEGIVDATHYTCLNAINYPGGPWFKVLQLPTEEDLGQ